MTTRSGETRSASRPNRSVHDAITLKTVTAQSRQSTPDSGPVKTVKARFWPWLAIIKTDKAIIRL